MLAQLKDQIDILWPADDAKASYQLSVLGGRDLGLERCPKEVGFPRPLFPLLRLSLRGSLCRSLWWGSVVSLSVGQKVANERSDSASIGPEPPLCESRYPPQARTGWVACHPRCQAAQRYRTSGSHRIGWQSCRRSSRTVLHLKA